MRTIGLVLLLVFQVISARAWGGECEALKYMDEIERTKSLIMHSANITDVLQNAHDLFRGGVTSLCALLRFDISEEGDAESIQVLESNPDRVLNRAAIYALRKYKFDVPDDVCEGRGVLLFQLSKDSLEE
ncbi:energy transducer TonB family protein [Marinimicrobium sp. ARAG 43.8]|uniref:energy transducer TonB family protein n=1 Tax=Marinimicrobium sp. ARAG 43.8 TaxID=3418719 RepID=UPI003CE7D20B